MSKKLIIALTIAAVIGIGTYAFGHMGRGYGNFGGMHMGGGYGGMHMGNYGEQGYYDRGNLNDEDIRALEQEREAFIEATENTRQNLYSKELELRSELIKTDPDAAKTENLQQEISELRSELDQKRIDHVIKAKKINPNAGRAFAMGGYHMGYGSNSPEELCLR